MLRRFQLDLAIPEKVYSSILPLEITAFRDKVRKLKALAVSLPGEATTRATWHRCYHDETPSKPCEPEQDI